MSWELACSLAISVFGGWGWYLFNFGIYDFSNGLRGAGSKSCEWKDSLDALDRVVPMCIMIRAGTLPYVWHYVGTTPRRWCEAASRLSCVAYALALFIPVMWIFVQAMQPGIRSIYDHNGTIQDWPKSCKVGRPFHGLLQTRFFALLTSHLVEATIACGSIASFGAATKNIRGWYKSGMVAVSLVVPLFGMIHGPIDFIHNAKLDGCSETERAGAYLGVLLVFTLLKFVVRRYIAGYPLEQQTSPFTSTLVRSWFGLAIVQITCLEILLLTADELKGGPPLVVCGNKWKEFFYPRFKGFVYFLYAELANMALWTHGCWQANQENKSVATSSKIRVEPVDDLRQSRTTNQQ